MEGYANLADGDHDHMMRGVIVCDANEKTSI